MNVSGALSTLSPLRLKRKANQVAKLVCSPQEVKDIRMINKRLISVLALKEHYKFTAEHLSSPSAAPEAARRCQISPVSTFSSFLHMKDGWMIQLRLKAAKTRTDKGCLLNM